MNSSISGEVSHMSSDSLASLVKRYPEYFPSQTDALTWDTLSVLQGDGLLAYCGQKQLAWDTDVLGIPCARIGGIWARGSYQDRMTRLTQVMGAAVGRIAQAGGVFASARIDAEDLAAVHAAENVGMRTLEAYLTFRSPPLRTLETFEPDVRIRLANGSDVGKTAELAQIGFRYNRYITDPCLPRTRAQASRKSWVENSFRGRADAIYVVEVGQCLAGFTILRTGSFEDKQKGVIDLIAVSPDFSRRGLGLALVRQSLEHYRGIAEFVEVGTQATNVGAVNLYTKAGFTLENCHYSLHWHADMPPGKSSP
jgi:ribosomal protein S18 acetylase RimI-like enzyme